MDFPLEDLLMVFDATNLYESVKAHSKSVWPKIETGLIMEQ